jgi:hypothetical protein
MKLLFQSFILIALLALPAYAARWVEVSVAKTGSITYIDIDSIAENNNKGTTELN